MPNTAAKLYKNRTITYLILAGTGVLFAVGAAGWMRYEAARQLNASDSLIQHLQDVTSILRRESQRIDRIGSAIELYQVERDNDKFRTAQTSSVALYSDALSLQQQVRDDAVQLRYAQQLASQANALVSSVNALTPSSPAPTAQLLACRETVTLMLKTQQQLLHKAVTQFSNIGVRSMALTVGFTVFAVIVVLVLFGILIRDAYFRQHNQRQLAETNQLLATTIRTLQRRAHESELLTLSRDELQLCMKPEQVRQSTACSLQKLLPGTTGSICEISRSRQWVEVQARWNGASALPDNFPLESCCGLRSGHERWRKPGQSEVHCSHFTSTAPDNYVCLPMIAHGDTLGMVYVECPSAGIAAMVEEQVAALHDMVEMASMTIANLNLRNDLEQQSIRDGLTGLFNRRFMEVALDRELSRAHRHEKQLALLMVDLDHFKEINDALGHEAGDGVLRQAAQIMNRLVRSDDIICRYGGEEFVVILPEISLENACARAERIRSAMSDIQLHFGEEELRKVTISIGVALYPQHGTTAEQLLRASDRALYAAKNQGRNRVVVDSQTAVV